MISIRSPGREGEHSNVKIKALAFVLMAVLLLCGCGQKSETAAATPAQAVTASAAQSSTVRPVSTGVTPEQFGAKGDGIADDLRGVDTTLLRDTAARECGEYFVGLSGPGAESAEILVITFRELEDLIRNS
jgi:hypothetical protein